MGSAATEPACGQSKLFAPALQISISWLLTFNRLVLPEVFSGRLSASMRLPPEFTRMSAGWKATPTLVLCSSILPTTASRGEAKSTIDHAKVFPNCRKISGRS